MTGEHTVQDATEIVASQSPLPESMKNKILVFEYLHADADLSRQVDPSMRGEGRGMLEGVLCDLSGIHNVEATVACSEPASTEFENFGAAHFVIDSEGPVQTGKALSEAASQFDAVIPIAPECRGMLTSTVGAVRAAGHLVIAPSNDNIDICCDKWKTWERLHAAGIPTVRTMLPPEVTTSGDWLQKPRDGTGGGGIVPFRPGENPAVPSIVQPRLSGTSHSVSIIGTGDPEKPLVLPAADQDISWHSGEPRYHGSCVPSEVIPKDESHAVAVMISRCLHHAFGYLNVDLFHSSAEGLQVLEINPRISSTYIAYRQLAEFNLMEAMLAPVLQLSVKRTAPEVWKNRNVRQSFH